jgi:hypothetical protein
MDSSVALLLSNYRCYPDGYRFLAVCVIFLVFFACRHAQNSVEYVT